MGCFPDDVLCQPQMLPAQGYHDSPEFIQKKTAFLGRNSGRCQGITVYEAYIDQYHHMPPVQCGPVHCRPLPYRPVHCRPLPYRPVPFIWHLPFPFCGQDAAFFDSFYSLIKHLLILDQSQAHISLAGRTKRAAWGNHYSCPLYQFHDKCL